MRVRDLAMPILLGVIAMTDGSNASPLDEFHWKSGVRDRRAIAPPSLDR